MAGSLSAKYIHLNPRLITECATGLDEWVDVAARYGFTAEEWLKIEARPEVIAAIESAKKELYDSGVTFKNKSKLCAEQLLDNVYKAAMQDDTPVKDKVSALQAVSKLAGLEVGPTVQAGGSGFSININLPAPVENSLSKETHSRADKLVEVQDAEVIDPAKASLHLEFGDAKKKANKRPAVRRVAKKDARKTEKVDA